ncbi:MAG: 4-hydroxybutyrate--acetyl-CoA CoA transferase [Ruminococcaceae bacterium]|nr:4-hydroxybutyrate--acetyl-CoA CoA transferase [Oscillospiraceae bacterium]
MNVKELYQSKKTTPQGIADLLQSGMSIMSDIALSHPPAILRAIDQKIMSSDIHSIRMNTTLDMFPYACYTDPASAGKVTGVSWFSGVYARKAINQGWGDIMPGHYHDLGRTIEEYVDFDMFIATVSPMDDQGNFSFGTTISNILSTLKKSRYICLEVNANMPRAVNSPQIHISQVTALCESDTPLPVSAGAEVDPVSQTIGNYIAEEIPDCATIQLGIGAIPDAVGSALKSKHHLGIHTEMFTDSMVELIECGAVDNSCKPIHTGYSVATFAFGSKKIYDYIHNNPAIKILPAAEVNHPMVIGQHPNFMSINSALEVDLYGQVCAESIGTYHVSGTGGQVDYVRGAAYSRGGKSFIAFSSTAKNGTVSRIKPILTPGAIVTTSKNDVDYIATEYGLAKLRGKTLSQRAKALISIAHPDFRDELRYEAKKQNILI